MPRNSRAEGRSDRAHLHELLSQEGFADSERADASARGRLELLAIERVLAQTGTSTPQEIADRVGIDVELLLGARRALGIPLDERAAVYGSSLEQEATVLATVLRAGLPREALLRFNAVMGRSLAAVAAAGRDLILSLLEGSDTDREDYPLVAAQLTEAFLPQLRLMLGNGVVDHLREVVRREYDGAFDDDVIVRDRSVAFVDVVGSTAVADHEDPRASGELSTRLEQLTTDALQPGVTLVKLIGDEVMLIAPAPEALITTVLTLLRRAEETGSLPALRAGAAHGPVMTRAGDWYGRPVNVASRLAERAAPGTMLCDGELHARAGAPARAWRQPSTLALRGLADPVSVYAVGPAG